MISLNDEPEHRVADCKVEFENVWKKYRLNSESYSNSAPSTVTVTGTLNMLVT